MKPSSNIDPPQGRALDEYFRRTPKSAQLSKRARGALPGGSSRSHAFFRPHQVIFEHGEGPYLWDVDGNRYVDFTYNGLSVIHGYAYKPIEDAIVEALPKGTAWVGTSGPQIAYAEYLKERIKVADLVRFTNTGTEATMLATKLARTSTGRPMVLKSWGAYHGSYDDLEAGLYGNEEFPGRTALARFGDLDSYRDAFERYPDQIAAIVVEPVLFTFRVIPPPEGFLAAITELAREQGALLILDDCLMFRLAPGGSAEKYGFDPDLTCLGKFIGGSLPMGVVAGREEHMKLLSPLEDGSLYHGGSFNGNPLASVAGLVALEDLTAESIDAMNGRTQRLRSALDTAAGRLSLPLSVSGDGSVMGIYVNDEAGDIDAEACAYMHLAAVNRGVFYGPDGDMALCTALDEEALEFTIEALTGAIEETATWLEKRA